MPETGREFDPPLGSTEKTKSKIKKVPHHTFLLGYRPFATWVPSAITLSYSYILSQKWTLEFEYSRARLGFPVVGIDLGSITQEAYTFQARRFVGNSFNFSFGALYSQFESRLGSDFIDNLGNPVRSSFEVENLGLTVGIGNRWKWENGFTLGVDWFRMNVPVFETRVRDNVLNRVDDEDDREDLKKVIGVFNRLPTFVLLGINLGYTF